GVPVARLKVDGGMTANHLLMQFVADVLDVPVERPLGSEAVSLGAAYAAGLAVGYWPDLEVLRANWHRAAAWEPAMDDALRRRDGGRRPAPPGRGRGRGTAVRARTRRPRPCPPGRTRGRRRLRDRSSSRARCRR